MQQLSILFIVLMCSQQILCQTLICRQKEASKTNEEFLLHQFKEASKSLLHLNFQAEDEWQCLKKFVFDNHLALQEAVISLEKQQDQHFYYFCKDIQIDNFEILDKALEKSIITVETSDFVKVFIQQIIFSFENDFASINQKTSLLQMKTSEDEDEDEDEEDGITAESAEEVAEVLADMTQAEADILDESESDTNLRGSELDDDEQSTIDGLLSMFNEALLLTLDVKGEANDVFYDIEDFIADEWEEDTQEAGEDCARYGGDFADNIYYVILNLDIDEFDILVSDNKKLVDDFKKGMDVFYEEWAEDEEDEDEEEYGEFYLLQTKEDEDESGSTEELMDLLVDALDKIREINSDANDVLYEASRLIESDWDDDYTQVAEDLFEEEPERTNYFYMEMVRLDVDEVAFLTKTCQGVLDDIFLELETVYEEEVGDDYEEEFIQKKAKLRKTKFDIDEIDIDGIDLDSLGIDLDSQTGEIEININDDDDNVKVELGDEHSEQSEGDEEEIVEESESESDETDESLSETKEELEEQEKIIPADEILVNLNIGILNRITKADDYVNNYIEAMGDYVDDKYDNNYDDATQAMYAADEAACDLIFAFLVHYDIDEITFLAEYNQQILDQIKDGLAKVYDDRVSGQVILKIDQNSTLSQWLMALEIGLELISNSSKYADPVVQQVQAYAIEVYDEDYELLAENCYKYDPVRTQYVFAWYLRLDIAECSFLSDDSIDFLNDFQQELMDVFQDEEGEDWEFLQVEETSYSRSNFLKNSIQSETTETSQDQSSDQSSKNIQNEIRFFCTGVAYSVILTLKVETSVNIYIEHQLKTKFQVLFDGNYEKAAQSCYKNDESQASWILIQLAEIDVDEIVYLAASCRDFLNNIQTALQKVAQNLIKSKFKKQIIPSYYYKNDFEVIQAIFKIIYQIQLGDLQANQVIFNIQSYIDIKLNKDFSIIARKMYAHQAEQCYEVYGWLARQDSDEIDFLLDDAIEFLATLKSALNLIFKEIKRNLIDETIKARNLAEFLQHLKQALYNLQQGNPLGEQIIWNIKDFAINGVIDTVKLAKEAHKRYLAVSKEIMSILIRLDVDELLFLNIATKRFIENLFNGFSISFEIDGEHFAYLLQKLPALSKLQTAYNETDKDERLDDKDYDEFPTYDTDENEDAVTQFCNQVVMALLLTSDVNSTVNTLIEDYLIYGMEEYFEDDYEQATADCYENNEEQGDWMLVQLAELDLDEASFLTSDNLAFWADWQSGLMDYAEENYADVYDDENEYLLVEKKMKLKSKSKEEEETDSAEWLIESLKDSVYRTTTGDETVNDLIQEMIDYIEQEDTYDNDYTEAAEDIYDYDAQTTSAVYGWLARTDVTEITFLSSDSISFYDDIKAGLDEVYEEEETSEEFQSTVSNVTSFLLSLSAGLSALYHGQIDGEAPIEACFEYYEDVWEEDAEALAEECYQEEYDLTVEVYKKFLRIDTDELKFLSDDSDQFLADFWNALQDVFEDEADEYEMLVQKSSKRELLLQTETEDKFINRFLQVFEDALRKIDNADERVNEIVPDLQKMVEDYWDNNYEESAWDSYQCNRNETNKLLLKFSNLDIDEATFISEDNMDWLNQWADELRDIYWDEIAEGWEDMFIQLKTETQEDDDEDSDDDDSTESDEDEDEEEQSTADWILDTLELVENCDADSNDELESIADWVEDEYDEDYEEAMAEMCEADPDKSADIFVILDSLDSDELKFLSKDNQAILDDIFKGMQTYYAEVAEEYEALIQIKRSERTKISKQI